MGIHKILTTEHMGVIEIDRHPIVDGDILSVFFHVLTFVYI